MSWKSRLKAWWKRRTRQGAGGGAAPSGRGSGANAEAEGDREEELYFALADGKSDPSLEFRAAVVQKERKSRGVSSDSRVVSELPFQDDCRLQPDWLMSDAPRLQMVVGLDFGTSYTKVVLGESRVRYAVPMQPGACGVERYTAPARVSVSDTGRCYVGEAGAGGRSLNDLKMPFLRRELTHDAKVHATSYLALVLRHARSWLLTEKRDVYRGIRLEWFVNVGLPTDNALDRDLEAAYRHCILAAWRLSAREGPITLRAVEKAVSLDAGLKEEALNDSGWGYIHPDAIRAFPEFAAQVSAYVQSPMKSEDLHALIDIGGGTVDVTLFNVVLDREEDRHRFPIFARRVSNLGTSFLMQERLKNLGLGANWDIEPQDPIPPAEKLAKELGVSDAALEAVDGEFRTDVQDVWGGEFRYTKSARYPRSPTWRAGLPVFVSGGGAHCDFYQEALKPLFPPMAPWKTHQESLPLPHDLEAPGVSDETFGRLAVAYGLSLDESDLGEIVRPENILDDRIDGSAGERLRDSRRIDKDMT